MHESGNTRNTVFGAKGVLLVFPAKQAQTAELTFRFDMNLLTKCDRQQTHGGVCRQAARRQQQPQPQAWRAHSRGTCDGRHLSISAIPSPTAQHSVPRLSCLAIKVGTEEHHNLGLLQALVRMRQTERGDQKMIHVEFSSSYVRQVCDSLGEGIIAVNSDRLHNDS